MIRRKSQPPREEEILDLAMDNASVAESCNSAPTENVVQVEVGTKTVKEISDINRFG